MVLNRFSPVYVAAIRLLHSGIVGGRNAGEKIYKRIKPFIDGCVLLCGTIFYAEHSAFYSNRCPNIGCAARLPDKDFPYSILTPHP
jgi:hypothetical protein